MRNIALQCFAFWTILNQNAICMMVWDISSEASTYMASSESTTMDGRKEYAYDGNPDTCYRSDGNNGDLQTGYTFIYSSNYFIHGVVITTSHLDVEQRKKMAA
ncbi:hypothetical protein SNE40_015237 [Patella caerulea]|uniref:Uncharacterized protein n=1 Tax=Patella caerulea TaxID=87958 RepID=A0AAN8JJJ3_PATCE